MIPSPTPPGSIVKGILTSLLCQFIAMCVAGGLAAAVGVAKMEKTRQDFVGTLLVGAWGFISWELVALRLAVGPPKRTPKPHPTRR